MQLIQGFICNKLVSCTWKETEISDNLAVLLNQAIRKLNELEYADVSMQMIVQAIKKVHTLALVASRASATHQELPGA